MKTLIVLLCIALLLSGISMTTGVVLASGSVVGFWGLKKKLSDKE